MNPPQAKGGGETRIFWLRQSLCMQSLLAYKNVRKEQELRKIEGDVRNNSHDESVLCFEN